MEMGKADWLWDEILKIHFPCCSYICVVDADGRRGAINKCGNRPLYGNQILTGLCDEHSDPLVQHQNIFKKGANE